MFTIVWILDIFGTDLCDSRGHLVFQKMFCTSFISYCTYIRKEVDQDQINVLTIKLLFLNEAGASRLTPSMMRRTNCSSSTASNIQGESHFFCECKHALWYLYSNALQFIRHFGTLKNSCKCNQSSCIKQDLLQELFLKLVIMK